MAEKVVKKRVAKSTTRKKVARKAPSRVSSRAQGNVIPLIVGGIFVVVLCISIGVGFLGGGQIDVQGAIDNRKIHGTEEEKAKIESIPAQNKKNKVRNNGLVPSSGADREDALKALEKPDKETASSSATSTDQTASSTDDGVENEASETQTSEVTTEEPSESEEVAQ